MAFFPNASGFIINGGNFTILNADGLNMILNAGDAELHRELISDIDNYRNTVNQTQVAATAPQTGLKNNGEVPVVITSPASGNPQQGHPQGSASSVLEVETPSNLVAPFRNSITVESNSHHVADKIHPHGQLRIHHGAIDQTLLTICSPPEVMAYVKKILEGMGVEIHMESKYKYRCIRAKKNKAVSSAGPTASIASMTMGGSAASNGIDKHGLPPPSSSPSAFSGTGAMLRGLLSMRRQSSQVSGHGPSSSSQPSLPNKTSVIVSEPLLIQEIVFGDPSQDMGDEVRFSVELTRLDGLDDTFSLDIRRLKGNLRSYTFLYDTLRHRAAIQS